MTRPKGFKRDALRIVEGIDKRYKDANVYIMLSEGKVIVVHSFSNANEVLIEAYYSLE